MVQAEQVLSLAMQAMVLVGLALNLVEQAMVMVAKQVVAMLAMHSLAELHF